ncbi:MAG: hypothetical protein QM767_07035 [Anaeromyxobacter sp.]
MIRRGLLPAAALAALALVAAGAVLGQRRQRLREAAPLPAGESTGPRGLAALRTTLQAAGTAVLRRGPGDPPAPGAAVVILAAPRAPLDEAEAAALLAGAEGGATLVWALGPAPQPALARRLGLSTSGPGTLRTASGLAPHPLVGDLQLPAAGPALQATWPGALPVSGLPGAATALSLPVGRGELLVLSGPEPLENAHLADGDALTLALRLGSRGPVALDERFLRPPGETPPSRRALLTAAGQLLLAALVWLWARGRRLGAIRRAPAEGAAPSGAGHAASLGALYARAGDEPALAAQTWRLLRQRLEQRAGLSARLEDADAARRLAARCPLAAEALTRGAAALSAGGRGTLLRVTRAAAEAEAALRQRR